MRPNLKPYQEKAINRMISRSKELIEDGKTSSTLIFQSPTGSGKTYTMARFIESVSNNALECDLDFCFLWVSVGKGGLHEQSFKNVSKVLGGYPECQLLEDEFTGGRESFEKNEVVFVDWEKLRNKDKATGEWKNILMKDKETNNFIRVLQNTREAGIKVVLIIDECHASASSERARELRDDIVCPFLTIEMSATPILIEGQYDSKIVVDPNDVINQGMIKKEVIINDGIDEIEDDEMTSQELVLKAAIAKRKELASLYEKEGAGYINPLILIQIPNSSYGEAKLDFCRAFLLENGIDETNGKLAIWLNEEKINIDDDSLASLGGNAEVLIFKQAIDTGWDCPRAQILVKFRETQSIVFEIQTLGRILRMPEAKHYSSDELNRGFVYTNLKSIEVKKETYNPNIIKSLRSVRSENYEPIQLKSYYKSRVDYGDLTSSFYQTFEESFANYFGLDKDAVLAFEDNFNKMKEKGVNFDSIDNLDEIIKNAVIESKDIDVTKSIDSSGGTLSTKFSETDLQQAFENIISSNLNGFAPKRSVPIAKNTIYYVFKKYLNLNSSHSNNAIKIQSIVYKNSDVFGIILDSATLNYKSVHEKEVEDKTEKKVNQEWEIAPDKNYNPNVVLKCENSLSLYQPFYVRLQPNGKADALELDFMDYLLKNRDYIEWFWQNGQEHMETNFGIEVENTNSTFQPDFIIKFKNGFIGIFDTKAIGRAEDDNKNKSNALQKYIKEQIESGKKMVGGLVVKSGQHFRYFNQPEYKAFKVEQESWNYFDNLLKE